MANPRHLVNVYQHLHRDRKALSRKKLGSANRRKARLNLATQYERVAKARADFQQKLSRLIIDENQATIEEMLKSANIMKSRRLARNIGDAAWSGFVAKLAYKYEGVNLVKLDQCENLPLLRSQDARNAAKGVGIEMPRLLCRSCRNINAAINIQHKCIKELIAAGHVVKAHQGLRTSCNLSSGKPRCLRRVAVTDACK